MDHFIGTGFYKELTDINSDSDFDFLQDEYASTDISASVFLHGYCNVFAQELSKEFGYKIEEIRDFENRLIHAYCISDINGDMAYIDIRGITTDVSLFFNEFPDVTIVRDRIDETQFEEGWLSSRIWESYKTYNSDHRNFDRKELVKISEAAKSFIDENKDFYDMSELYKRQTSKGNISQNLDSKINEALNKAKLDRTGFVTLIEKDIDIGFNVDKTFCISLYGKEIGYCAISEIDDEDGIYLEWIDFSNEYKGKHLLRPALLAIGDYFNIKYLLLDSSESNMSKYLHLGAEETFYDDIREVQGFKLSVDKLTKEIIKADREAVL